ncbi:MAG: S41 family peptidase, partial [Leadbetterella sp.]|nr:S41 family peptidase [Leadbetterella sp.]
FFIVQTNLFGQNCNCDSTFKIVKYHIEHNYAGWFDKNKQFVKQDFEQFTKTIDINSKKITIDSLCYKEIKRYVSYFQDKHLHLDYYPVSTSTTSNTNSDPIRIEHNSMTETEMLSYLKSSKQLDKAEGIWENETYKIGIIKSSKKANLFDGIIITSKNENWKAHEIKLYVEKKSKDRYILKFITGDKTELIEKKTRFFKNILDAQSLILGKQFPKSIDNISIDDYSLENDPSNPKLTFPKNDLAVWTFPNFYSQNEEVVQTLFNKHKEKLATTKYWIIDLRDNEGGDVSVGNLLLPFIYTKPIIWSSEKIRLTEDNFNNLYNAYIKEAVESLPIEKQKYYDSTFAITKTHFGEFGSLYNEIKTADTITFDKELPSPQKIVILINENTFSSGELFTILAKQSDKVIVMGQKSAGSIDYGNVLKYKTNCPGIRLTIPSSRNNWLDQGISIDRDKIQPEIYISKNIKNWLEFAYNKMAGQAKKNGR